jgi:hypothetical protein
VIGPETVTMGERGQSTCRFLAVATLGSLLAAAHPAFSQNWIRRHVPAEENQGTNWIWTLTTLAASADGSTIIVASDLGPVCVSQDWGTTWKVTPLAYNSWFGVSCSEDGSKMSAVSYLVNTSNQLNTSTIFTSADSGNSWTPRNSPSSPHIIDGFVGVAGSADGTRLLALVNGKADPTHPNNTVTWDGGIYLSTDAGASWRVGGTGASRYCVLCRTADEG